MAQPHTQQPAHAAPAAQPAQSASAYWRSVESSLIASMQLNGHPGGHPGRERGNSIASAPHQA